MLSEAHRKRKKCRNRTTRLLAATVLLQHLKFISQEFEDSDDSSGDVSQVCANCCTCQCGPCLIAHGVREESRCFSKIPVRKVSVFPPTPPTFSPMRSHQSSTEEISPLDGMRFLVDKQRRRTAEKLEILASLRNSEPIRRKYSSCVTAAAPEISSESDLIRCGAFESDLLAMESGRNPKSLAKEKRRNTVDMVRQLLISPKPNQLDSLPEVFPHFD